jgi:hypothetical protein
MLLIPRLPFRTPIRFTSQHLFGAIIALLAALLFVASSTATAQGVTPPPFNVRLISPNVIRANVPTDIVIGGGWAFACSATVIDRTVNVEMKRINISLVPSSPPCNSNTTWEVALPSTTLPLGTYEVSVDIKAQVGNTLRITTQTSTFISAESLVDILPLQDVRLFINAGAANQEQFLSVTHLESCPPFVLQPAVVRNGNSVDVTLAYTQPLVPCLAVIAPPRPVVNVISLGQLPAGTYNVNVSASVAAGNAVNVARLPLTVGNAIAPPANATGAWYDPNESGWGLTMIESNSIVFATWYVFDSNNQPRWYVMAAGKRNGATITGEIYAANGSDFRLQWQPDLRATRRVGTAYIQFKNEQSASVTSVYDNTVITRSVSRLQF